MSEKMLLVMLAFSVALGAAWLAGYWIDRAFWHLDNRRRSLDKAWRLWWRE